MKKYKLKTWVVCSIYIISIFSVIGSGFLLGKVLSDAIYSDDTNSYVYHDLIRDSIPVINYETNNLERPYSIDNIDIYMNFYNKDGDSKSQENSLLYYKGTYMPNTGIFYKSEDVFDVLAVLDGTIESIVPDEMMGNIITIKHSNTLSTVYQSLNEVKVMIGDTIKKGDIIGTSGQNKLVNEKNMLLFEVISNGEHINPEELFNKNVGF